jgi:hypothetical protein
MWLDDCRIPFVDEGDIQQGKTHFAGGNGMGVYGWNKEIKESGKEYKRTQGRFTPNLLVCDDMLNDGNISNSTGGIPNGKSVYGRTSYNESSTINTQTKVGFGDKGTNSRYYDLDLWFDKMLERL